MRLDDGSGHSVHLFVSHVNAHHGAFTSKEALSNQTDKKLCPVVSATLSVATPVPAEWDHEPSDHSGPDIAAQAQLQGSLYLKFI